MVQNVSTAYRSGMYYRVTRSFFGLTIERKISISSDFNRCKDTPFIIQHQSGTDTIRVNQIQNGSKWNSIWSYYFSGDSTDAVIVSEAATIGTYIIANAIRIVTYDSSSLPL